MELSEKHLKDLAYQLVQHRGGSKQARKEAQNSGDDSIVEWSLSNLSGAEKAKAPLQLMSARDTDRALTKLTSSIDAFNAQSGKLYRVYLWLTGLILLSTAVNTWLTSLMVTAKGH